MSEVSRYAESTTIPSIEGIRYEKTKERKKIWLIAKSHIRRILIEILNFFLNHDIIFWLIGNINKRLELIESVFLVYPANEEYGLAYAYHKRLCKNKWIPWFVGIFQQNGKIGIKFAISASNGQFRDPANKENLRSVVRRMEELRKIFYAERKTFAGILSGILFSMRLIRETHEAESTVKTVIKAIERVKMLENLPEDIPIIVLGGRGFIGRRVIAALPKSNTYCVDIAGDRENNWPFYLKGEKTILVNASLNSVLDEYLYLFWSEIVVISDVYPEPSPKTVNRLKKLGCICYHIAGVKGRALPSFPHGYQGGIPCCAAWLADEIEPLLLKLV